jgi:hypothetical protein
MACQNCGDEIYNDGNFWRHQDEDERGLDDDHEGEPSDEDEERDDRERWEGEMDNRRDQIELGKPVMVPKQSMLRSAAIEFIAAENVTDREELLFRAHRHASIKTASLPVPVAQRTVHEFVAAVSREAGRVAASPKDEPCEGCNAEAGEDCRPWCTGSQAKKNDKADKKHSYRTAAVADFPDELMF